MKHAGAAALDSINDLLAAVRLHPELKERTRGHFYHKSAGFLHFHEDTAGLFADLKVGRTFERFPVSTDAEQEELMTRIAVLLGG